MWIKLKIWRLRRLQRCVNCGAIIDPTTQPMRRLCSWECADDNFDAIF